MIAIHKPRLEEGNSYKVMNDHIGLNNGDSDHTYRINFNLATKVQLYETTISTFAFDFASILDILSKKGPKGYLIDMFF